MTVIKVLQCFINVYKFTHTHKVLEYLEHKLHSFTTEQILTLDKHTGVLKARSVAQVAYRCRHACIIPVKDGHRFDQISFVCIVPYHNIVISGFAYDNTTYMTNI